jgi:hypothetical protein
MLLAIDHVLFLICYCAEERSCLAKTAWLGSEWMRAILFPPIERADTRRNVRTGSFMIQVIETVWTKVRKPRLCCLYTSLDEHDEPRT